MSDEQKSLLVRDIVLQVWSGACACAWSPTEGSSAWLQQVRGVMIHLAAGYVSEFSL